MFESKFGKVTTIIMVVLIASILVGIGVMGYSIISENRSSSAASKSSEQSGTSAAGGRRNGGSDMVIIADDNAVSTMDHNVILNGIEIEDGENSAGENGTSGNNTVKKELMEGYEVIGNLKIPSIKLNYKVLSEVTKKSLETSLALIYTEKGLNQVGNTVIIGHNYKNGTFFSNLPKVKVGDTMTLKDKSGTEIKYKVVEIFEAKANDSSFYKSNDLTKKTLILSTCTDDAAETEMRNIVRAEEIK